MPRLLNAHALPLLLLGMVLAIYWGRVLRMAYKARRRTGRAANLLPGEKLGRVLRIIWGPVVFIWVVHPFVTAMWSRPATFLKPTYFSLWVAWPGLVIASACLALSRICWHAMGRHWRMGIDPGERNPLIAAGPFSRVRHPIYALSILLMLATMVMIPSPLMLLAGIIHISFLVWESRREEKHLLAVHGPAYAQYQSEVGAFFPKI